MEPIPLLVHEVYSPDHPTLEDSEEAIFTMAAGQEVRMAQRVYLQAIGRPTSSPPKHGRPCRYPLYNTGIEGPVVGAKEWTVGVEYVVKNDLVESRVRFAYVRVPWEAEVSASPEFVRELVEKIASAARDGCEVWCLGRRTPTFLCIVQAEGRRNHRMRMPKAARAPAKGLGPISANVHMARRMHAPTVPSPLAQGTSEAMEE